MTFNNININILLLYLKQREIIVEGQTWSTAVAQSPAMIIIFNIHLYNLSTKR